ncbi:MAG: hypothetical protein ACTS27_01580 [Phycisphaerales bacterium]
MAKRSRVTATSLFEDTPRLLFATNRANILPVLSSGLIRGRQAYEKYYDDLLEPARGRIPVWRGAVPSELRDALTGGVRGMYPVVAELSPSLLGQSDVVAIRGDGGTVRLTEQQRPQSDDYGYLIGGPVPISAVTTLHFGSPDDLEDFKARDFDNVLPLPAMAVSEELFGVENAASIDLLAAIGSAEPAAGTAGDFRRVDSAMGAVAMACLMAPPRPTSWLSAIADALSHSKTKRVQLAEGVSAIASLLSAVLHEPAAPDDSSSVDERLLFAAARYLLASSPKDGWVETQVLDAVASDAAEGATPEMAAQIHKWQGFVRSVANSEREAGSLDDSGSVVRRALMLLILRHEPDRIIRSSATPLRPGPTVRALAGSMSGLFFGYSRLSRDVKLDSCEPGLLAELATSWWSAIDALPRDKAVSSRSKLTDALHGEAAILVGGKPLVIRESSPDDMMMRLFYHAKNLGFGLTYDMASGGFIYELASETRGKPARTILFEQAAAQGENRAGVRIVTACLDSRGRGIKVARKEDAVHLLERNADPATRCRFAVDPSSGHVQVLVHQLLDTMDSLELRSHVESVISTAASYEAFWQQRPTKSSKPTRKKSSSKKADGT